VCATRAHARIATNNVDSEESLAVIRARETRDAHDARVVLKNTATETNTRSSLYLSDCRVSADDVFRIDRPKAA
jgi:hypothetical protein